MRAFWLLLIAAALAAGCSSSNDEVEALREQLDRQNAQQLELRTQLRQVETTLGRLTGADGADPLRDLRDRVDRIDQSLSEIRTTAEATAATIEDLGAELRVASTAAQQKADAASDAVETLRGDLQRVTEDLALLNRRFEDHSGPTHP